jgi:hypothetical protein
MPDAARCSRRTSRNGQRCTMFSSLQGGTAAPSRTRSPLAASRITTANGPGGRRAGRVRDGASPAGEHAAHHDARRAEREGLHDVPRRPDAAVGDARDVELARETRHLHTRTRLLETQGAMIRCGNENDTRRVKGGRGEGEGERVGLGMGTDPMVERQRGEGICGCAAEASSVVWVRQHLVDGDRLGPPARHHLLHRTRRRQGLQLRQQPAPACAAGEPSRVSSLGNGQAEQHLPSMRVTCRRRGEPPGSCRWSRRPCRRGGRRSQPR